MLLLNDLAFLKHLGLVTLYERSKKKWEPLKAKGYSWGKLELFFFFKDVGHLLTSKKVYSHLHGKRCWAYTKGSVTAQLWELWKDARPWSLLSEKRNGVKVNNVLSHWWMFLRRDVCWQNWAAMWCWLRLSQVLHGLEGASSSSGSVTARLLWRFLYHQQSRTAQTGSAQGAESQATWNCCFSTKGSTRGCFMLQNFYIGDINCRGIVLLVLLGLCSSKSPSWVGRKHLCFPCCLFHYVTSCCLWTLQVFLFLLLLIPLSLVLLMWPKKEQKLQEMFLIKRCSQKWNLFHNCLERLKSTQWLRCRYIPMVAFAGAMRWTN